MTLRRSYDRWMALHVLMAGLERCAEHTARLDVYSRDDMARIDLQRFERRMDVLRSRLSREMNRLTVEQLEADLVRKQNAEPAIVIHEAA